MKINYTQKDIDRFWSKVDIPDDPDSCWEWLGGRLNTGYGKFWCDGKTNLAHRFSYQIVIGDDPEGLCVCHHCDNPLCVRTDHLFAGTQKDNMKDMDIKKRRNYKIPYTKGEKHGQAKLTWIQVQEIRNRYANEKISQKELARQFDVSQRTIGRIIRIEGWK